MRGRSQFSRIHAPMGICTHVYERVNVSSHRRFSAPTKMLLMLLSGKSQSAFSSLPLNCVLAVNMVHSFNLRTKEASVLVDRPKAPNNTFAKSKALV